MNSLVAGQVDNAFVMIIAISVILLAAITAAMIYFIIKYHWRKHPTAEHVEEKPWLEITWTTIPTILVLGMFWFGYDGFRMMRTVPDGAMTVKVTARMWSWSFEYANGITSDKLYVPIKKPVKLLLTSLDVIHGFYLPAFRIKEDVVPGKENYLWFEPLIKGEFDIFCSQYCGQRHSYMLTKAVVIEEADFKKWYDNGGQGAPQ